MITDDIKKAKILYEEEKARIAIQTKERSMQLKEQKRQAKLAYQKKELDKKEANQKKVKQIIDFHVALIEEIDNTFPKSSTLRKAIIDHIAKTGNEYKILLIWAESDVYDEVNSITKLPDSILASEIMNALSDKSYRKSICKSIQKGGFRGWKIQIRTWNYYPHGVGECARIRLVKPLLLRLQDLMHPHKKN